MKADTRSLVLIFGKDVRYVVPLYQRPYVWKRETHWEPLWEDVQKVIAQLGYAQEIAAAAPEGSQPPPLPPHFLGAIVLDLAPFATGSVEERSIIDGQQRLTTLQLFIAAASEVAASRKCEKEARLLRKLTENDPDLVVDPDDQFKVWPTNVDRDPFRSTMLRSTDDGREQTQIQLAYDYFVEALEEWANEPDDGIDIAARFAALTKVVRELLKLVVIDLEPGDNAQIIFETLNARGMPLHALDLVKNLVFQRAAANYGTNLDQLYSEHWAPFESGYWREDVRQGRLNRPRSELFLMHWLTMQTANEVGAHHLFTTFRDHISTPTSGPIGDIVREFSSDAKIFKSFDDQPSGSTERRFFDMLDVLDTSTALPIALVLFRQNQATLSVERRRRSLDMLESWLVRRMLCRFTTKNYNRFFLDTLKALKADPGNADCIILDELRSSPAPSGVWPTDAQVRDVLESTNLYGQVNQRRIVMVLSAIEGSMRTDKSEAMPLPAGLTIEHVLPQGWRQYWPVSPPDDALLVADRDRHVHRLGNLTLVTAKLNPALSNSAWPTKRPELNKHSVLLLNRRIIDEHPDTWDEVVIDTRSSELTEHILKLWPGPTSSVWD